MHDTGCSNRKMNFNKHAHKNLMKIIRSNISHKTYGKFIKFSKLQKGLISFELLVSFMKSLHQNEAFLLDILHGAVSFLRNEQLLTYLINSPSFMDAEGSLPCSQEPITGTYPKPVQCGPKLHIIFIQDSL
jgi:hypothetical protein